MLHLPGSGAELLCAAAIALQAVGGEESAVVVRPLVFHPSADVRERGVYALAQAGGTSAVDGLMACLYDPVIAIRVRAIYGLARLQAREPLQMIRLMATPTIELRKAVDYYLREVT